MATASQPALPKPPSPSKNGLARDVELVEYDRFIEKQIRRTRQTVKLVDLAYGGLQMLVGVIVLLLAATLIEHWLVTDGLGRVARFVVFSVLIAGCGYFFVRRMWPLVWSRINPVYAAHTIEKGHPTLKNSLVNFLLFRTRREQMPAAVYEALEQQAARGLAHVLLEHTVDRTPLIRLGYVLVGLVVLGAAYAFFSAKHPFATAGRVLAPWANIPPPSRVDIARVDPGTATVTQGETLTVSAEVRDLREGESVHLRYTTADGQQVDAVVPMRQSENGYRYEASLPPPTAKSLGLDEDLSYRIEAGDARTVDYKLTVVTAPAIIVRQVEYEYPDYTGYLDQAIQNLGDIRGIEGTRVTIRAEANGLIDSAEVDFDSDGRSDLRMQHEGKKATASFVLGLREDRRTPLHNGYTLRFKNQDGRTNLRPAQYQIDVTPDYSPEVEISAPEERLRDVRLDETVVVSVNARDPDFGLTDVTLIGQSTGRQVFESPLLVAKDKHEGQFRGEFRFTPSEHDLKPGDEVQYWATARDNRMPNANEASSSRKTFRIVDPEPQQPDPNQLAQRDPPKNQDPNQQQDQGGENGEQNQPGQQGDGEGQPQQGNEGGQKGDEGIGQPGESNDGEPGENQGDPQGNQGGNAGGEGDPNAEQQPGEQGGHEGGQGRPQEGGEQNGEPQPGQPGENNGGEGQPGDRSEGQPGEPSGKQEQSPVDPNGSNDGEAFERISEHLNQNNEGGQSGEPRPGENGGQTEENQPGEGQPGQQQPGEGVSRDAQSAEQNTEPSAENERPQDDQPGANSGDQSKGNENQAKPGEADKGERNGDEQPQGRPDQQRPDASPGTGAKTQQGSSDTQEKAQQAQEGETKSSGGEEQRPRGDAGQGAQEKPEGAPDSDEPMQQRQKKPGDPDEKPPGNDQEPGMPGTSRKESDSRGEQGGDRSGGGEEGGGQKSPREGTGSSGQNQAADEGAGMSADQGPGENSNQAGSDAESHQPTGEPGEKAGSEGSGKQDGTGEQPGGKPGEQSPQGGDPGDQRSADNAGRDAGQSGQPGANPQQREPQANENPGQQPGQSGAPSGAPTTGGTTGTEGQATPENREAEPGDEANLEYARRQTELTLEKLSDQLRNKEVDQKMLDKLGWSEDDLKKFVERWQQRHAAAKQDDPQAKSARQELDQALKSLGLRPRELSAKTEREQDTMRDLQEGNRGKTPLEWQEWLRAYSQGVGRGQGGESGR